MQHNIISLTEKAEIRRRKFREKAIQGIDAHELHEYYEEMIKTAVHHLSFLQRYLVEEYLYAVVEELFSYGVEVSKSCVQNGYEPEEMIEESRNERMNRVNKLSSRHLIHQYVGDWDLESVMILADDMADRWFVKGLHYGIKQRKLKLL